MTNLFWRKKYLDQFAATISLLKAPISKSLEFLQNITSPKSASPTRQNADQTLIQRVKDFYSDVIISNIKDIVLFPESIASGMKVKNINSKIKAG